MKKLKFAAIAALSLFVITACTDKKSSNDSSSDDSDSAKETTKEKESIENKSLNEFEESICGSWVMNKNFSDVDPKTGVEVGGEAGARLVINPNHTLSLYADTKISVTLSNDVAYASVSMGGSGNWKLEDNLLKYRINPSSFAQSEIDKGTAYGTYEGEEYADYAKATIVKAIDQTTKDVGKEKIFQIISVNANTLTVKDQDGQITTFTRE